MIKAVAVAAATLFIGSAAHAGAITYTTIPKTSLVTYSSMATPGETFSIPVGSQLINDFDGDANGAYPLTPTTSEPVGATFATGIYDGSYYHNLARPPFNGQAGATADSTHYYAVLAGEPATLKLGYVDTGLGLLIGSPDDFNSITFNGTGGFTQTFTGTELGAVPGVPVNPTNYYEFAFNGHDVTSVTFSSSINSLEFDDLSVSGAPEPAIWAMLMAGVGLVGGALRVSRRRLGLQAA